MQRRGEGDNGQRRRSPGWPLSTNPTAGANCPPPRSQWASFEERRAAVPSSLHYPVAAAFVSACHQRARIVKIRVPWDPPRRVPPRYYPFPLICRGGFFLAQLRDRFSCIQPAHWIFLDTAKPKGLESPLRGITEGCSFSISAHGSDRPSSLFCCSLGFAIVFSFLFAVRRSCISASRT